MIYPRAMPYPDDDVETARLLKALAHPARLAMVRALAEGGCCCGDIVRRLPLAQSTVSQHLKILRDAGLIEGPVDGPRAAYALDTDRLQSALAGLDALMAQFAAASASACCTADPTGDRIAGPADLGDAAGT